MTWTRARIITAQLTLCGLTGSMFAGMVDAMTLAPITVRSYLGQILIAEVDILNLSSQEESSLRAAIASPHVFADLKMDYSQSVGDAQIELLKRPFGLHYLQVRSRRPMVEPLVDLVIEVSSSVTKFVRPYRLALDPAPLSDGQLHAPSGTTYHAVSPIAAGIASSPLVATPLEPASWNQPRDPKTSDEVNLVLKGPSDQLRIGSTPQQLKHANSASPPSAAAPMPKGPSKASAVGRLAARPNLSNSELRASAAPAASSAGVSPASVPVPELGQVPVTPNSGRSIVRKMSDLPVAALEILTKSRQFFLFGLVLIAAVFGYILRKRQRKRDVLKTLPGNAPDKNSPSWATPNEQAHQPIGGDQMEPSKSNSRLQDENRIIAAELDPVAQADVYLAYEQDGLAEEILHEGAIKDPKRVTTHLKLAQIYAARRDTANFDRCADQVLALAGTQSADWAQIQALNQSMKAAKPGYYQIGASAKAANLQSDLLEFENASFSSNTTSTSLPGNPPGNGAGWDPVLSLTSNEESAAADTLAKVPSPAPLFFDMNAPSIALAASPYLQAHGSSEQLETSMELAEKFIDIGDLQSARRLLHDVLAHGSDQQRQRALAMMPSLT